ncbi:hypothetical protein RchiOBHm_Chr3g0470371 [Rosa chinensis]|uniref:Uncharacterized protein n=1 Tax=Rosa chinensis TaxID=74649 RepID=A0A2P6RB14_ROSCH|nr:hypothetical protein RchiOBHm_Chr3g0470371 [Rosa chinensis]
MNIYIYIYNIYNIYYLTLTLPRPTSHDPPTFFFLFYLISLYPTSLWLSLPHPFILYSSWFLLFVFTSLWLSLPLFVLPLSLSPPLRLHLSVALSPSPFLSSPFIQLLFFKDITTTPLHSGILGPPPSSVNLGGTTIVAPPTRNALQICSN